MKIAIVAARLLLGLPLVVFGLNGFLHFIEPPADGMPERAVDFLAALEGSGYLVELKSAVEVVAGLMLLLGRFVPFALVVFAPIMVNIVAFHLFLDEPAKGVVGYVMLGLHLFLAWAYWPSFRGVLAARGAQRS